MRQESAKTHRQSNIPDIEIIDLDLDPVDSLIDENNFSESAPIKDEEKHFDAETPYEENDELYGSAPPYDEEEGDEDASQRSGNFFSRIILHIVFVLVLLFCIGLIFSPFSDGRDSDDSVVSLADSMTDATFYNCSVAGSHLAAAKETFLADEDPMDAFNLYWLSTLITLQNTGIYDSAFAAMGDAVPADARYAYDTLSTLDFQNVDVLAIMYDASDYLEERPLYNMSNPTDIQTFAGNMDASLELLCNAFPHLRIIVMSPTYAYYVDENGEYISSDIHKSNGYSLSTYAGNLEHIAYEHSVSYLDNIYGTVNEVNAKDYLEDHLHLNPAGRKRLAERFVYALEYFD